MLTLGNILVGIMAMLFVATCLFMMLVILIQKPKGGGLSGAFGGAGGSAQAAFGAKTGDLLTTITIAYEPVWAIGTGKTATPQDAQDTHKAVRAALGFLFNQTIAEATRIQYGGSCKPSNANELFAQPDIDGGLIGGAALKASDFLAILQAAADKAGVPA